MKFDMFNLPTSTEVKKIIPKNSFDSYITNKQKKEFSVYISKITWINKLSFETINLQGKEIEEIQIFTIELKEKNNIKKLLDVIDKTIPYTIIFIITFNDEFYVSTSPKHSNPNNPDHAVIDYTFTTEWSLKSDFNLIINLKNSLDWLYKDFCEQFKLNVVGSKTIQHLVESQKELDIIKRDINKLKLAITNSKQFNKKVALNLKLKELEKLLNDK
ncbi:DUF4391 domain-containing protein [Cloacibacterium normanense]|uniref:DUF4391 domain-containing protein n=1 Tax=Cloacibacterium normanense TaxID=237258 RepID=UPI00352C2E2D